MKNQIAQYCQLMAGAQLYNSIVPMICFQFSGKYF